MAGKKTVKYVIPEIPDIPTDCCETVEATQQYAAELRFGIEALSRVSPKELHNIVVYISKNVLPKETILSISEQFDLLFNNWWNETCVFSGPNLCYDNDNYRSMKQMGKSILPLIEAKAKSEPQYKQRHIQWLKMGIES